MKSIQRATPLAGHEPQQRRGDGRHSMGLQGSSFVEACLRRKLTVLAGLVICVAAAAAYLFVATPIYSSTSRLYVDENGLGLLSQESQSVLGQSDAYLLRQCQVIRSEPILRQAILQCPVEVMHMYRGSTDPVASLLKNLTVDLGKKDEIISLELASPYPKESARLVNAIVSCYENFQTSQSQSTTAETLKILQREKDKQEQVLDERLKEVVAFKQKNGEMFFTNDKGMNILMQNLASISEQLTKARLNAITVGVMASRENNRAQANVIRQESEQQVAEFEKAFEAEKTKALEINSAQAEYQKMQLEADRTTKMCDLLDARIKELDVTKDGGTRNIRVLDVAKPEDRPSSPKKTMTLLAGIAAGLVVGGGMAMGHDRLDQRIRTPDEAARLLSIPVIGIIPAARDEEKKDRSRIGTVVYTAPCSGLADAHQALGMALHVAWPSETFKTLLVTSPNRGDGKSTTCSNLAIAMAQAGRKTLLIDADLRRPVQHEIFGVLNTYGVADVLSRGMRVEDAIHTSEINGLSLLTCGEPPANAAELTSGPAFAKMLQRLEEQYDLIIIDSPPILAAPDARILGAQSDAALLVLCADSSTRQDAEMAAKRLVGVGTEIMGIVLNNVARGLSSSYYESEHYDAPRERTFQMRRADSELLVDQSDERPRSLTY